MSIKCVIIILDLHAIIRHCSLSLQAAKEESPCKVNGRQNPQVRGLLLFTKRERTLNIRWWMLICTLVRRVNNVLYYLFLMYYTIWSGHYELGRCLIHESQDLPSVGSAIFGSKRLMKVIHICHQWDPSVII